jgi:hypothetical protein
MFPWQKIHSTIEELLDGAFSVWSMPYVRSVCVVSVSIFLLSKDLLKTFLSHNKELLEVFSV